MSRIIVGEQVLVTTEKVTGVQCDRCGAIHKPTMNSVAEEGLCLKITGGYGEYIDGVLVVDLCQRCCSALEDFLGDAWSVRDFLGARR